MLIDVNPKWVFRSLMAVILALTAAGTICQCLYLYGGYDHVMGFRALFNLNGEMNIPAVYSSLALLASAIILVGVSRRYRAHRMTGQAYLLMLAFVFAYLAVDEMFSFHERLQPLARQWVDGTGLLYATWVVPGALFAAVMFCGSLSFLGRVDRATRNRLVLSGMIFVGGAIGMEMLGWAHYERTFGHDAAYQLDLGYLIYSTLEEFMEMSGVALFINALLRHVEIQFGAIILRVGTMHASAGAAVSH